MGLFTISRHVASGNDTMVNGDRRRRYVSVIPTEQRNQARRGEILAFIVLAILIWPVLAVATVGGYGFLVWMFQLVLGPPGPPS